MVARKTTQTKLFFNHRQTTRQQDVQTAFCFCDLDLDPMTLMYELVLDFPKTYHLHTKNKLSRSRFSKIKRITEVKFHTATNPIAHRNHRYMDIWVKNDVESTVILAF